MKTYEELEREAYIDGRIDLAEVYAFKEMQETILDLEMQVDLWRDKYILLKVKFEKLQQRVENA